MEKDILFIGHATPEDNYFAAWLATKLELLGYTVWVDAKTLEPATDFWKLIEKTIREETTKYIFVASKNSVLGNRDGVSKELYLADQMRRNDPEFIVPVRIDNVSYSEFRVEFGRQNAIDFYENWALGLSTLVKYLEKKRIPRRNTYINSAEIVERWTGLLATVDSRITSEPDRYTSNIFPVSLPEKLYVYRLSEVEEIFSNRHYPYRKIKQLAFTFVCPRCVASDMPGDLHYEEFSIAAIMDEHTAEITPFNTRISNPKHVIVEVIGSTVGFFLYSKGLRKLKPESRKTSKVVYYFRSGTSSKRSERSRLKKLSGSRKNNRWHYALSAYYTDYPQAAVLFKWHLVFTDSNGKPLSDGLQVSARRSKGRTFYNKQWCELMETAMYFLADGKETMCITACCSTNAFVLQRESVSYLSHVGYVEPRAEKVVDDDE